MKVHFIGISGIGMSAAALLAKDLGFIVSGSADTENDRIVLLKNRGIEVFIGHRSANVKNPDMVVYTNAVSEQNEELKTVRAEEIPAFPRLIFLGRILPRYPKPVIG
ncbi:MAG TPA: Mur ligase domain-containing protein, partial [Thermotogota bacterium]|nr:Mur ligase domain-containing protein [Thermotogota bacterium]